MATKLVAREVDMLTYLKNKIAEEVEEGRVLFCERIDQWFVIDRFCDLDPEEVNFALNQLIKEGYIAQWRTKWGDSKISAAIGFLRLPQEKTDVENQQPDKESLKPDAESQQTDQKKNPFEWLWSG